MAATGGAGAFPEDQHLRTFQRRVRDWRFALPPHSMHWRPLACDGKRQRHKQAAAVQRPEASGQVGLFWEHGDDGGSDGEDLRGNFSNGSWGERVVGVDEAAVLVCWMAEE